MKDRYWIILVWTLILAGVGLAWTHHHTEDDAFITFRYSKHLAEGIGPVWNADQRVEGYTNFLWMAIMAMPIALGMDPVLPATILSLIFLACNLWLLFRISARQTEQSNLGFWAWLPVAASHTLLISATSGLETAMNGFLWTLVLWQLQGMFRRNRIPTTGSLWILGICCGLAQLSRPEAALLAAACLGALFLWLYIARHAIYPKLLHFCAAFSVITAPWLIWKMAYYGSLVPNTFFAKTHDASQWIGFQFVLTLVIVTGCWLPWLVLALTRVPKGWVFDLFLICSGGLTLAFLAYAALAGGDYMEFRLLVPVLPFLLMAPLWRLASKSLTSKRVIFTALLMVGLAVIWGQGHGRFFKIWYLNSMVHPVNSDSKFMSFESQGKALGSLLGYDPTIRLAIGACGAIPYYSKFYGIDLYGLNEPSSDFTGYGTGYSPGHARLADFSYIQKRMANLISIRCDHLMDSNAPRSFSANDPMIAEVTHGASDSDIANLQIVDLPLGNGFVEVCIYLHSHATVDSVIKSNSLKIHHLDVE